MHTNQQKVQTLFSIEQTVNKQTIQYVTHNVEYVSNSKMN